MFLESNEGLRFWIRGCLHPCVGGQLLRWFYFHARYEFGKSKGVRVVKQYLKSCYDITHEVHLVFGKLTKVRAHCTQIPC